MKGEKEVRKK